jgi:hypothetical protein
MKITLATLPQATAQEVFDQVALHLLTQGRKSRSADGCFYRGPNGLMCAAGCLIADDEYNKEWDETPTGWCDLVISGVITSVHSNIIDQLQSTHDFRHPCEWKKELEAIAAAFSLSHAVVTNFGKQS